MTTIAVKRTDEGFEVAADRQTTAGSYTHSTFEKVFERNGVTFAVAGRVRTANILKYADGLPKAPAKSTDTLKWIVTTLVPALQTILTDAKAIGEDDGWSDNDCDIIVMVRDVAVYIGCDFAVTGMNETMWVVGSGTKFALGAMSNGADAGTAVAIAGQYDVYTGTEIQGWMVTP